MRLATFNVENLFERAKIMNLQPWSDGKAVLEDYTKLAEIIEKQIYSAADKATLTAIMKKYPGMWSGRRGGGRNEWLQFNKIVLSQIGGTPQDFLFLNSRPSTPKVRPALARKRTIMATKKVSLCAKLEPPRAMPGPKM